MKEFLRSLQASKSVRTIEEEVSPDLDVSSVLLEFQNVPLLFKHVTGSSFSVAGNLYSKRSNIENGLGIEPGKLLESLENASREPASRTGRITEFDRKDWMHSGDVDLSRLPILKNFDLEAGRYITAGIVVAKFPGSNEENLSVHRMLVLSKNKVAARIVPRHLTQIGKSAEGRIPVSVVIGPPPAVFVSASLQIQYGLSEYRVANKLAKGDLQLSTSQNSDISIPVDSEIVLEGFIDFRELVDEGPFVDLTGTYDAIRKQPTITFESAHYKANAVYQTVIASSLEHSLFMGLPQEIKLRDALYKSVPGFRAVNLTAASGGYFHCIVSVDKASDGDGKTAIINCFAASHPLKLVIAVDADIDPFDQRQVEWALATRFQSSTGLVTIDGARGSSLDPSSSKVGVTSKLGLDATLPMNYDRKKFERARANPSEKSAKIINLLRGEISS